MADMALSRGSAQLQRDALCEVDLSSSSEHPTDDCEWGSSHSLIHSLTGTFSCMDLRQQAQTTATGQRQSHCQHLVGGRRQLPTVPKLDAHSSPLPQTRWSEVPLSYRPRDWIEPRDRHLPAQHDAQGQDAPTDLSRNVARLGDVPAPLRPRRITRGLSLKHSPGSDGSKIDYARLYPAMGPYDGLGACPFNVSDDLQSRIRSVSQPHHLDHRQAENYRNLPSTAQSLPRSPTDPSPESERIHNTTGTGEAAFRDEEEFRLFVQATVGLSPDFASRPPPAMHPSWSPPRLQRSTSDVSGSGNRRHEQNEQVMSPITETLSPTTARAFQELSLLSHSTHRETARQDTMIAYQQVPTMPETLAQQSRSQQQSPPPHHHPRRRPSLQTSVSCTDIWPSAMPNSFDVSPVDLDDYEDIVASSPLHDEDELPDYAQSQAEAQAQQRIAAARRAQELQRRWQESASARR